MRRNTLVAVLAAALMAAALPATAAIHEIIGAGCRTGGFENEVVPPGQVKDGQSFLRALQATGVIASIVGEPGVSDVTVTFDLDKPNSKYMSGGDLTIPDAFGPGSDLTLLPLPIPDPDFPAHKNCKNLNP